MPDQCMLIVYTVMGSALVLLILKPVLKKMMGEVHYPSTRCDFKKAISRDGFFLYQVKRVLCTKYKVWIWGLTQRKLLKEPACGWQDIF